MRPLPLFGVFFLLLPFIEIWLLIKVGSAIGALPTILLLILAGVAGVFLLRHQGFVTLTRLQRSLNAGELPAQAMLEGALLVLAGLLFLIPGFFTDILGLLLVLPPTRYLLLKVLLKSSLTVVGDYQQHPGQRRKRGDIEGEVVRRQDDDGSFLP
ncbi:FxsA family protein [Thiothrix nivea]|uniref:FxsA cytoplasmic membrane protein n=1 Tax=Thiothrix nivea (strain ATCC 35100 / DSM 5205 / JP2) TaxID=870187 RepID=A0A656HLN7_THINJ|nr:FxsA family protein [Thiothrix nivea]EIJ36209.1 FxsA cytoplasmic membrane protein [Thiothrix nivea DSM 5205]